MKISLQISNFALTNFEFFASMTAHGGLTSKHDDSIKHDYSCNWIEIELFLTD